MRKVALISAAIACACAASSDVLWDQYTGDESAYACYSQDFESELDVYDVWAADDYVVGEPGWVIESVDFAGFFSLYEYATVERANFFVWPDRGDGFGDRENPVFTESGLEGAYLESGELSYTFATPIALEPGNYAFCVQIAMPFSAWGQFYWYCSTMQGQGTGFAQINPNGGFGWGSDWWVESPDRDASFRLNGQVIPEPGAIWLAGLLLGAGGLWVRRK